MAKKRTKSSAHKQRKNLYRAETYGIKFDSLTFLLFSVFVLVAALWIVWQMFGAKPY